MRCPALPLCVLLYACCAALLARAGEVRPPPGPEGIAPPREGWTPADSVRVAWADARMLEPEVACVTRYLDLQQIPPEDRPEAVIAHSGHWNLLSRATNKYKPVLVGGVLLRINLLEYRIDPKVYERLADADPYYHLHAVKTDWWPGGVWPKDGKHYRKGSFRYRKTYTEPAPWLTEGPSGRRVYDELANATHSAAPLLRADWVLSQTAIQRDRAPTGYYDFLGVKTLDDLNRLSGVRRKSQRAPLREAVALSAVANKDEVVRSVERLPGEDGGVWLTYDLRIKQKLVDPRRVPGETVEKFAEAIEYFGLLPNGGPLTAAVNAQDRKLQDTVPDFIAQYRGHPHDSTIHPNVSCLRCHAPGRGLQPIDDWFRNLMEPPLEFGVYGLKERLRFNEEYGRRLFPFLDKDRQNYEDWAQEAAGTSIRDFSEVYAGEFERYTFATVDAAWAARDLGVTQEAYQAALDAGLKRRKLDTLLAAHRLSEPRRQRGFGIRTWEQLYPLAMFALRGQYPVGIYHHKGKVGKR